MKINWKIVTKQKELLEILNSCGINVVIDFETKGVHWFEKDFKILGVALGGDLKDYDAIYVPNENNLVMFMLRTITNNFNQCIFHNAFFDYGIIESLGFSPLLYADTQLVWHLVDNSILRKYGLKTAQKEILKWEESNDKFLEVHIKNKMKQQNLKGDWHTFMYIADIKVLAEYAALDAYSTYEVYKLLWPKIRENNSENFFNSWILPYMFLLQEQYKRGIFIDLERLKKVKENIYKQIEQSKRKFNFNFTKEIKQIVRKRKVESIKKVKTLKSKKKILRTKCFEFNINSKQQLAKLLFEELQLSSLENSKISGLPKVDIAVLKNLALKESKLLSLINYNKNLKKVQYVEQYVANTLEGNILHPRFNQTGTVSGRLSGFKPNLQQLSKEYLDIIPCFRARKGYKFIVFDFCSVEPMITAHFSKDKELKKVLENGWDIYLELVESIYGKEKAKLYDRNNIEESKKRLKKERDVLKILHLSAQYGATEYSISRNLWGDIIFYHLREARNMLRKYWKKFNKVKELEKRLKIWHNKVGYIINGVGRLLFFRNTKDIANRFIQATAHDCLIKMNLMIRKNIKKKNLKMYPLNIDIHDSSCWEVKEEEANKGYILIEDSLRELNDFLGYSINLKIVIKIGNDFSIYNSEI